MKKQILLYVLIILMKINISAQCSNYYTTVQTPAGETVDAIFFCEFNENELAIIEDTAADWINDHNSDAIRIGPASGQYNCHAYAWHVSTGGNKVWLNNSYGDPTYNVDKYFSGSNPSYESATSTTATKAFYGYNDADHSAYATGETGVFISKWGAWPLYIHEWDDCPFVYTGITYYKRTCDTIIIKDVEISSDLTIDNCHIEFENVELQNNSDIEINITQSFSINSLFDAPVGTTLDISSQ